MYQMKNSLKKILNRKIDLFGYKIEGYDNDNFIRQLDDLKFRYIVIVMNPTSGYKIVTNLEKIYFENKIFLCSIASKSFPKFLYSILFPILFFVDHVILFQKFKKLFNSFEANNCFSDNTYGATYLAYLRKKNKIDHFMYASFDWIGENSKKINFFKFHKYLFSKMFVLCDYYCCKNADITLNHTMYVEKGRKEYWKKNITKKEKIYKPFVTKHRFKKYQKKKKTILFLGQALSSSSLDKVLLSIKESDYRLKIIGVGNPVVKKLSLDFGNDLFSNTGYLERDQFAKNVIDCFVGINLVDTSNDHSKYTVPSKVVDYLRYGIPVLATPNIGVFHEYIRKYKMGIIVDEINAESIKASLDLIFSKNTFYSENINNFFETFTFDKLNSIIK